MPFQGGGIIAVSYEARAFGVTRNMRGDDAKEICPQIHLCRVQESRGEDFGFGTGHDGHIGGRAQQWH